MTKMAIQSVNVTGVTHKFSQPRRCSCPLRWAETVIGLVFILSALLKAVDLESFGIQISYLGFTRNPVLVQGLAVFVLALECVLGALALAGVWRKVVHPTLLALLVSLTGVIVYGWVFKGLEDCGCFGKFIKMSPSVSIAKNLILLALLGGVYVKRDRIGSLTAGLHLPPGLFNLRKAIAIATCAVAFLSALAYGLQKEAKQETAGLSVVSSHSSDKDRLFARFQFSYEGRQWDLSKGEYIVAMLSDSCSHCQESVNGLNHLPETAPGLPPVVSFILGEEETLEQFRQQFTPQFPTTLLPPLEFFELIGNAPPRFYVIRDGRVIKFWDDKLPSTEELNHLSVLQ